MNNLKRISDTGDLRVFMSKRQRATARWTAKGKIEKLKNGQIIQNDNLK